MDALLFSIITLVLIAFICEFVDSSLGMGYGTTLTPLLILLNYPILQVVPAVLFSEFFAATIAAVFHHYHGNVQFDLRSHDFRISLVLAFFGIGGGIIAVLVAISVSPFFVTLYISCLIILMGGFILSRFRWTFSWRKITIFGVISAFNKGISGGGYGPVVAGGQIITGRDSKRAIGSTALAESVVCLTSWALYVALGVLLISPESFFFLELPLMIGAVLSAPLATYAVKLTLPERMTHLIGAAAITLGIITLMKTLFGDMIAIAIGGITILLLAVCIGIIESRERTKNNQSKNQNN